MCAQLDFLSFTPHTNYYKVKYTFMVITSFSVSSHKEKKINPNDFFILVVLIEQSGLYYHDHGLYSEGYRGTVGNLMHCFIHNQFSLCFARTALLIMLPVLSLTSVNPLVTLCSVLLSLTRTPQIGRTIKGELIANSSSYFPKFKIEFGYNKDSVSVK